jgi:hypothetical protein
MFLKRRPPTEQSNRSVVVYFLKFLHPSVRVPLQCLGSIAVLTADSFCSLFPIVSRKLRIPEDTQFRVCEEVPLTVRRVRESSSPSFGTPVAALIFELNPGSALPETDYECISELEKGELAESGARSQSEELPSFLFGAKGEQAVSDYLTGSAEALVFLYEAPTCPVAKISFPRSATVDELTDLVAMSIHFDYNPQQDTLLIYNGDVAHPEVPSQSYISSYHCEVTYQFGPKKAYRIFARIVLGIVHDRLVYQSDFSIEFSEDAVFITKTTKLFMPHVSLIRQIRDRLVERDFIPDIPNLRFFSVLVHYIYRVFEDLENDSLWLSETLRIDIVPDDQLQLLENCKLVETMFLNQGTILTAVGSPFFFTLRLDETCEELNERMKNGLKLKDDEFKRLTLMISQEDRPFGMSSGVIVKGTWTVQELLDGEKPLEITDPHLFVVGRPTQTSYFRDESVKIYN